MHKLTSFNDCYSHLFDSLSKKITYQIKYKNCISPTVAIFIHLAIPHSFKHPMGFPTGFPMGSHHTSVWFREMLSFRSTSKDDAPNTAMATFTPRWAGGCASAALRQSRERCENYKDRADANDDASDDANNDAR